MITFALSFIVGLLIGVFLLRLLATWEPKHTSQQSGMSYKRHHS